VTSYLLAFLVTWTPVAISETLQQLWDKPTTIVVAFTVMSSFLVPLTGFLDSIIYGWDGNMWSATLTCLRSKRPKRSSGEPTWIGEIFEETSNPERTFSGERSDTYTFSDSDSDG